ncbi:MAG: hypothetical protein EOP19_17810 [Hyphomicrobiales bacterium]|nr:MAG: hypothetical protein EOP19_17810 [Hyphomicrobiales bacterium]
MQNDQETAQAERPGPDWEGAALDYLYARLTIAAICRKYGVSRGELLQRAVRHKWKTLRTDDTDREILIGMMLGVLEQQIGHLEKTEMTQTGDKEVAVLGKLATTLEKLIDIEDKSRAPAGTGENMQELRNKLARRIENLKRK